VGQARSSQFLLRPGTADLRIGTMVKTICGLLRLGPLLSPQRVLALARSLVVRSQHRLSGERLSALRSAAEALLLWPEPAGSAAAELLSATHAEAALPAGGAWLAVDADARWLRRALCAQSEAALLTRQPAKRWGTPCTAPSTSGPPRTGHGRRASCWCLGRRPRRSTRRRCARHYARCCSRSRAAATRDGPPPPALPPFPSAPRRRQRRYQSPPRPARRAGEWGGGVGGGVGGGGGGRGRGASLLSHPPFGTRPSPPGPAPRRPGPQDGEKEVTDMFSFYSLPSSVLKHEKHPKLHAATATTTSQTRRRSSS